MTDKSQPQTMTIYDLREPEFDNATRVHDWRNYVGQRVKAMWVSFSDEQRLALALDASEFASHEKWD